MPAQDRSLRQKHVAGAVVLGAIFGTAWLATGISDLFEPEREAYVTTTTAASGAAGLAVGGPVLYGGAPRGYITSVETSHSRDSAVGRIRIAFELDRSLPLAKNASIVKSVGVAGSGGALSVLAPGDPALAFTRGDPRVIPMNRGSVASPDGIEVLLGRRNAELLRSIEVSLDRFGDEAGPRIARARRMYDSIRLLLDQLELDIESEDLPGSVGSRLTAMIRRLQSGLPELQRTLSSNGDAMQALEQDVRSNGGRIQGRIGVASRNLADLQDIIADLEVLADSSLVPKLLRVRRDAMQAMMDSERLFAEGTAVVSEAATSIPDMLANMKLAGGQLALAFDDLLGLVLEAIMIAPDADSEARRRLLEAVGHAVQAGMDVRLAADRMRNLAKLDPSFFEDQPELRTSCVEPFQAAVDRLETTLDRLATMLAETVEADGDARPTPVP